MRSLILSAAALTLVPASSAALAQQPVASAETAAESAGRAFLEAFNSQGSIEPFIASSFTQTALGREPAAERARALDALRTASGGFTLLSANRQGERMVEMFVVSNRGGQHGKIVLFTSGKEPGKIADIFILSSRDPAKIAADRFPEAKVPDGQVAAEIRKRVDALAEEGRFSGVVLVARGDDVILREARGLADQVWRIPNRADTRFNIASIGKIFTATAVMRLVEQGKLSLDDTLAERVPAYPHKEAAKTITLRHLLNHTGGLGDWDGRKRGTASNTEAIASMTAPPGNKPGERFAYSNAGYVILGGAIENVTGKSFEDSVRELVFEPAGMRSTGYWPVTAVVPNRATGYLRPPSDPLGFGPRYSNEQFLGYVGDASGGVYSNADDLLAFYRALAGGRLVQPGTLRTMIDNAVEFAGAPHPWRYGYGLRLAQCSGKDVLGHGGGGENSGVSNESFASVDGEWTVIVLANVDSAADDLSLAICDFVHRQ